MLRQQTDHSESNLKIDGAKKVYLDQFKGPSATQILWNQLLKRKAPLKMLTDLHYKYGSIVKIKLRNKATYFVNDADLIKQILVDNNRNYQKQPADSVVNPLLGKGLLTSDGNFWRRQRRLAQPAFHRRQIDQMAGAMAEATEERLNQWEQWASNGSPFDLADEMMKLTLDIVTRTLFGNALSKKEVRTISQLIVPILHGTRRFMMRSRWLGEIPRLPSNRIYSRQISELDIIVNRLIKERKASGRLGDDLLGLLLSAVDEETGEGMSDRQLRDEVMTLFLAGHETTANLMAWSWMLLGYYPAVERSMRFEIEQNLGDRSPLLADLANLSITQSILKESMRLFPPAWIFQRSPLVDDSWHGQTIEAGSRILICTYTLHRSSRYWKQPELFVPSRFQDEDEAHHRFAFVPFGGGPRLCIGQQFAMLEATVILTRMAQRYNVRLSPTAPMPEPETAVTLRPKNGVWVQVEKR